jgi:hypothetical protein
MAGSIIVCKKRFEPFSGEADCDGSRLASGFPFAEAAAPLRSRQWTPIGDKLNFFPELLFDTSTLRKIESVRSAERRPTRMAAHRALLRLGQTGHRFKPMPSFLPDFLTHE